MKKIVVIGAGAAGMMAAATSALNGNDVVLIEKMNRPGRKIMITGKGRCNVTNAMFDVNDLIENVTVNNRFLYSAFSSFMPYDTIALFEDLGVATKVERGGRVFPQSDKAVDIVDALVKYAKNSGVKFVFSKAVDIETENNKISSVILENGEKIYCDALCIATGGLSYPGTGSDGDGYRFAKKVGHTVTQLKPGLVGLNARQNFIDELQGLSLKNVAIKVFDGSKEIYSDFGEMLFTHFGVSGPMILSASSRIKSFDGKSYKLHIDLKPALNDDKLDKRIQRDFKENANKDFINSLSKLLPSKLVPVIVRLSGIDAKKKVNQITKSERIKLVETIKDMTLDLTGFRPIEEAIITRGGISVDEIEPKTMKSKLVDNLYFAGEIIDVDAYTGGFNLQIAFSTGYLCGKNM